jgi:hypothetical protein
MDTPRIMDVVYRAVKCIAGYNPEKVILFGSYGKTEASEALDYAGQILDLVKNKLSGEK